MTQDIKARLASTPFVPFVICTSDGKEYPVPHQDFAFVSPGGTRVDVYDRDDISTRIPILHISGLRDAPALSKPRRTRRTR
jgi:hypothetical protein